MKAMNQILAATAVIGLTALAANATKKAERKNSSLAVATKSRRRLVCAFLFFDSWVKRLADKIVGS